MGFSVIVARSGTLSDSSKAVSNQVRDLALDIAYLAAV